MAAFMQELLCQLHILYQDVINKNGWIIFYDKYCKRCSGVLEDCLSITKLNQKMQVLAKEKGL